MARGVVDTMEKLTPMLQQYYSIKSKYQDCLLMFRLGDFYELFEDDAVVASRVLEITLTGRDAGLDTRIPMCGVPYHAVDSYIATLVKHGYKVAICDQVEDPKTAKGVVKREVTRVVTPGTVIEGQMLDAKVNNYLTVVAWHQKTMGLAAVDVSTGEFRVTQLSGDNLAKSLIGELERLSPAECLIEPSLHADSHFREELPPEWKTRLTPYDARAFQKEAAYRSLLRQLGVTSLTGFNLEDKPAAIKAAGAAITYLSETQMRSLTHISNLVYYAVDGYMIVDASTRRNLELTETIRQHSYQGSLLWVLDRTLTPMGGRLLRHWLERPLIDRDQIVKRQDAVQAIARDTMLRASLQETLQEISDLERLCSRVVYGSANPRDLASLSASLGKLPALKGILGTTQHPVLTAIGSRLDLLEDIHSLLGKAIVDDPPISVREGGIIRPGYSKELDELRELSKGGKEWIARLEQTEREKTGIKSLKVGFNKVFGYYLEVTKANLDLVPTNYIRKQTLANAERFITEELKEKEAQVLGAEDKAVELEYQLFVGIRDQVANAASRLLQTAAAVAELDVYCSLAQVAVERNYVRPTLTDPGKIVIRGGRHPVVEAMQTSTRFVPNDVRLDKDSCQVVILTGPNMAGKSTYLRMVACIVLMAQIGSFVPADEAEIGLVDRIFTRVGASDDLGTGQSTFMVEMNEVMLALSQGSERSLIIIDELGRGTSTYDGVAIARAVAEYIHDYVGALTIFSTHYHELADLELTHSRIRNYRMDVMEKGKDVIFLYKVVRGKADKSYGIHVAKLAGLPESVLQRARTILEELETTENFKQMTLDQLLGSAEVSAGLVGSEPQQGESQSPLDEGAQRILAELAELDCDRLTPIEALNLLATWKSLIRRG